MSAYTPGYGLNDFRSTMPPTVRPVGNLHGSGTPEGIVEANPGTGYTDSTNNDLYVKFSGVQREGWILVGKTPTVSGGGATAAIQVFAGTGSPVGVVFPTTDAALYTQTDSTPAGVVWSYYDGVWH